MSFREPAAEPASDPAPVCRFCREPVAHDAAVCPQCDEPFPLGRGAALPPSAGNAPGPPVPVPARSRRRTAVAIADVLAGLGAGIFVIGLAGRVFVGPLPDLASTARSLRFLEVEVAAVVVLLLARHMANRD